MSITQDRTQPQTQQTVTYYVNGRAQQTTAHKLTVRTILTNAGFAPAEDYQLVRDEGHHVLSNLDEEIPLREDEHFTALFQGPTPVS